MVVDRGPNLPLVALTIDDGLDPTACQEEFEWLQANSIPATFFPTWVGVAKDHDLWRQIAAAGYPIGDHTLTHIDIGRHTTPVHTITHQLADARTRIEKIIGHPLIPVWRPPYGDYSKRSLEVAGQLGFHTMVEWSMTSGDSGPRSKPEGMIQRAIAGGPGTILLTHCNDQVSADILPAIVQGYLDKGFTFVTVPDMLRPYGLGG